jgi:hypothetical protein
VAPEPEGSSPHSQQPANVSYPEPGESTPHPPTNQAQDPFWSHPPIYALVFQVVSFPWAFLPKPSTCFCLVPCVQHVPPTSITKIMATKNYKSKFINLCVFFILSLFLIYSFLPINIVLFFPKYPCCYMKLNSLTSFSINIQPLTLEITHISEFFVF